MSPAEENLISPEHKRLDETRSNFIFTTAHQLRTPIISMKWICEILLKGDVGKLNDQQEGLIRDLYNSANHMNDLVGHLLSIVRIESEQLAVNPEFVDFNKIYNEVVKEFQPLITQKAFKVTFKKEKDLPPFKTDAELLSQILKNLLSNSIKYTPAKGRIELKISLAKPNILFIVKDSGLGIPKEQQSRVFEKFFRGDNITKIVTEGTGLGLYIVKNLVEILDGKIWFESKESKGTTFYFTLPVKLKD